MNIVKFSDREKLTPYQRTDLFFEINKKINKLLDYTGEPTDRQMAELYILESKRHLLFGRISQGIESFLNALIHLNINVAEKHCGINYMEEFCE